MLKTRLASYALPLQPKINLKNYEDKKFREEQKDMKKRENDTNNWQCIYKKKRKEKKIIVKQWPCFFLFFSRGLLIKNPKLH